MSNISHQEISWSLHETFLTVMREGSLSAAARRLQVAQPTVRRRIEALEERLGACFFTRSPNGLEPTDAARQVLPHAAAMKKYAAAFARSASGSARDASGIVRLTASEIVGSEILPTALCDFSETYPRVQLELSLSNANADLLQRESDVAIRMVRPTQAALVAKKVGVVPLGLFAARDYIERKGKPESPAELGEHRLIGAERNHELRQAVEAHGATLRRRDFVVRSDSDTAQLSAVRAGLGIGVCQVPLSTGYRELVRVLPALGFQLDMWVVAHEDLRHVQRVRVVFDHLVDALAPFVE